MEEFKATIDKTKEDTAVLLVRDEEKVKINIPLFLLPPESREGYIWRLPLTRKKEKNDKKKNINEYGNKHRCNS